MHPQSSAFATMPSRTAVVRNGPSDLHGSQLVPIDPVHYRTSLVNRRIVNRSLRPLQMSSDSAMSSACPMENTSSVSLPHQPDDRLSGFISWPVPQFHCHAVRHAGGDMDGRLQASHSTISHRDTFVLTDPRNHDDVGVSSLGSRFSLPCDLSARVGLSLGADSSSLRCH
jgi:hypothetical protein